MAERTAGMPPFRQKSDGLLPAKTSRAIESNKYRGLKRYFNPQHDPVAGETVYVDPLCLGTDANTANSKFRFGRVGFGGFAILWFDTVSIFVAITADGYVGAGLVGLTS